MNVYLITPSFTDYDTYDAIAIAAKSKERALEMVFPDPYFYEWQEPLKIRELDLSKEQVILESFRAG